MLGWLATVFLIATSAFGQGPNSPDNGQNSTPTANQLVDAMKAADHNDNLHQEKAPAPGVESLEATKSGRKLTIRLTNHFEFSLDMSKYPSSVTHAYEALSGKDRLRFLKMREWAMASVAKGLSATFFVPGITMVAKDMIYYVGRKSAPLREMWWEYQRSKDFITLFPENSVFRHETAWQPKFQFNSPQESYRTRINSFLIKALVGIDRALIRSLAVSGAGVELAVVPTARFTVGAGENRVSAGVTVPRYFTVGINWLQKAIVIRNHYTRDRSEGGINFGAGLEFRMGIYLDQLSHEKNSDPLVRGKTVSPPGPQNFVSYPDRSSAYLSLGGMAVVSAVTTMAATGSVVGTVIATLFAAGWEWGMFSYGQSIRADLSEVRISARGIEHEVQAGRAEVERIKHELWNLMKESLPKAVQQVRAVASNPRTTVENWSRQRETRKAQSCVILSYHLRNEQ